MIDFSWNGLMASDLSKASDVPTKQFIGPVSTE